MRAPAGNGTEVHPPRRGGPEARARKFLQELVAAQGFEPRTKGL